MELVNVLCVIQPFNAHTETHTQNYINKHLCDACIIPLFISMVYKLHF